MTHSHGLTYNVLHVLACNTSYDNVIYNFSLHSISLNELKNKLHKHINCHMFFNIFFNMKNVVLDIITVCDIHV